MEDRHYGYLVNAIAEDLHILDLQYTKVDERIRTLISYTVGVGKPMQFDDETGYPKFSDDSDSMIQSVVAVRVVKDAHNNLCLEFNNDVSLAEDSWYDPKDCGEYDLHDLFENVAYWIELHPKD